jgi:acetyl-CoA/propionyl-CoA carboxylase carboxyl transferase subunit
MTRLDSSPVARIPPQAPPVGGANGSRCSRGGGCRSRGPPEQPAMLPRDPRARLAALFDPGTLEFLPAEGGERSGAVAGVGLIHGAGAVAFASDPGSRAARWAPRAAPRSSGLHGGLVARRPDRGAVALRRSPAGGGRGQPARGGHGVRRDDGGIRTVPQISVVLGPAAGGAAYGPALTDIVILSGQGRIFVTGPDVVRSVTGEDVDMPSDSAVPSRTAAAPAWCTW